MKKGGLMNKSNKFYKKALRMYEEGNIDKAIEMCERSIGEDMKNRAAVDLKGMLCYLKGDLNAAKAMWELNIKINKDGAAGKHIADIDEDENRFKYFISALNLISKVKISEALSVLKRCTESDFNYINVNNNIALCYIKQAKYEEAKSYIDKVLKVDKNNEEALKSRRYLVKLGVLKKGFSYSFLIRGGAVVLIILAIIVSSFYLKNHIMNKKSEIKKLAVSKPSPKLKKTAKKPVKAMVQKPKEEEFNATELKSSMDNKNYDEIYNYVEKFSGKQLGVNDKIVMANALRMLQSDGAKYFYETGNDYGKKNDYKNEEQYLLKAYKYGSSSYIYPDVIYFLGNLYNNQGDNEKAIKYYEQYDENYKNGSYTETVLYNLAVIYKDVDKEKARNYASKIINEHPKSIYNNSVIKSISQGK